MSAFNNVIQWYESAALDKPELRSPTPCPRGVYCQYKLPNKETNELELACCRMVHPGEEGNGRRLFPARQAPDGRQQPACVRLTGKAGFYERCRLKQPWRVWAAEQGIPLPPADVPWVQVERGPILRTPQEEINEHSRRVMRMRFVPAGGAEEQQARMGAVLARSAMVAVSRAGRDAAKPVSAAATVDWPALPYRAQPNPSAVPAPINFSGGPFPPPRLNLSGGCPSYGFTAAERMRPPPQIQRLRSDRLYDEDEETGCATPSLLGSVNEGDLPFPSRVQRIDEKLEGFLRNGASLEEAIAAATHAVNAEIVAMAAEGGMDGVD